MPADYESTARALSLPISPVENTPSIPAPSSDLPADAPIPPWAANRPSLNAQRLSTPYSRSSQRDNRDQLPFGARVMRTSTDMMNGGLRLFQSLTWVQQLAVLAGIAVLFALGIVALVFSHRIFGALGPIAKSWRELPGGWVIIWLLIFFCSFPPMIGYSTLLTVGGFVFDFPNGWPIVASATVVGSLVAFVASRTILSGYVHRLVGSDRRFIALGQVLRHDGLWVLAAIRFCPLPFSLSNGFLATIPSITPLSFALATALASPKLLIHVFIGSCLAKLAESGDTMSAGAKALNYLSMILGGAVGVIVGLVVYRRTMARAKDLAREEAAVNGGVIDPDGDLDYEDLEEGLLRGVDTDADAAALMSDDDLSLWESQGADAEGYRDDADDDDDDDDDDDEDGSTGTGGNKKQAGGDSSEDGKPPAAAAL